MVKGHVFLPKINILSDIFFLLDPKHFVVYGASKSRFLALTIKSPMCMNYQHSLLVSMIWN